MRVARFWRQVCLLLWKNAILKIRQPVFLALEIIWPVFLFGAILLPLRLQFPAQDVPDSRYRAHAMPSAGLFPFMQSVVCDLSTGASDYSSDMPYYPNASVNDIYNLLDGVSSWNGSWNRICSVLRRTVAVQPCANTSEVLLPLFDTPSSLDAVTIEQLLGCGVLDQIQELNDVLALTETVPLYFRFANTSANLSYESLERFMCGDLPVDNSALKSIIRRLVLGDRTQRAFKEQDAKNEGNGNGNGTEDDTQTRDRIAPKILFTASPQDMPRALSIMRRANRTIQAVEFFKNMAEQTYNCSEFFLETFPPESQQVQTLNQIIDMLLNTSYRIPPPLASLLPSNASLLQAKELLDPSSPVSIWEYVAFISNASLYVLDEIEAVDWDIFTPVSTEAEMQELSSNYVWQKERNISTVFAGIVLEDFVTTGGDLQSVKLRIRMNSTYVHDTTLLRETIWIPGPENDAWKQRYLDAGFVFIQDMVERGAMEEILGHPLMSPGSYLNQMPYPCYRDDLFAQAMIVLLPISMTLAWLFSVATTVRGIVLEKELRLREVMRMMGLSDGVLRLSWYITATVIFSISVTIISAILKLSGIVQYTNVFILWMFLMVYALAMISYCFLIATFFTSANLGACISALIYFVLFFGQVTVVTKQMYMGATAVALLCLVAPIAFGIGSNYLIDYELQQVGLQWSNLLVPPLQETHFNFLGTVALLLIDALLYFVAAWYLEAVFPGKYGVAKPFYFPFQPTYWGWVSTHSRLHNFELLSVSAEEESDPLGTDEDGLPLGISVQHLGKVYTTGCFKWKKTTEAVKDLSLNFYEGQITALLGHNGAGKTTTMSLLTGLFGPTSGSAFIYGNDIRYQMDGIRHKLGVCPQHNVLFENLTVQEHMLFYGQLKGMSKEQALQQIPIWLEKVNLIQHSKKLSKDLSGGTKRKLSIMMAFLGNSRTVILDEPTSGVDPHARRQIWDFIGKQREGHTIILSTHHMDEAEILGDRIAIIAKGSLRCYGSFEYLRNRFGEGHRLTLVSSSVPIEVHHTVSETSIQLTPNQPTAETTVGFPDHSKDQTHNMCASDCIDHLSSQSVEQPKNQSSQSVEQAMNQSSQSVEQTVNQLSQSVEQAMNQSSQSVEQAMNQSSQSVEQAMNQSSQSVEQAVNQLSQSVEQAVNQSIQSVEQAMNQSSQSVEQAVNQSSQSVEQAVNQSSQSVEQAVNQSSQSTCLSGVMATHVIDRITGFINGFIPRASLVEVRGPELHYILPLNQSPPKVLSSLFEGLSVEQGRLGVASFGLTACSLDEIFLRLADDSTGDQSDHDTPVKLVNRINPVLSEPEVVPEQYENEHSGKEGSVEEGSVEVGSVEEGAVEEGAVEEGTVEVGAVEEDSVEEGAVEEDSGEEVRLWPRTDMPPNGAHLKGPFLWCTQYRSLLAKRFHYFRHKYITVLVQMVFPLGIIALSLVIATVLLDVSDQPPLELSPALFFKGSRDNYAFVGGLRGNTSVRYLQTAYRPCGLDTSVLVETSGDNTSACSQYTRADPCDGYPDSLYSCMCPNCSDRIPTTTPPPCYNGTRSGTRLQDVTVVGGDNAYAYDYLSSYIQWTENDFIEVRYGGLSFGHGRGDIPSSLDQYYSLTGNTSLPFLAAHSGVKAWYSLKGYHAMPAYLNSLNNVILRSHLPPDRDPTIYGVRTFSHPFPFTNLQRLNYAVTELGSAVVNPLAAMFAVGFLAAGFVLLIIEEKTNKVKHLQLVCGLNRTVYWVSSATWDLCSYIIFMVATLLIYVAFQDPNLTSSAALPSFIVILISYGAAVVPWMYALSFFFNSPSTAYIVLFCLNFFTGFCLLIVDVIIAFLTEASETSYFLVYMPFPSYCLGRGMLYLTLDRVFQELVATFTFKPVPSPFVGMWPFVVSLWVQAVVYTVCLVLAESRAVWVCPCRRSQRVPRALPLATSDELVAKERERVLASSCPEEMVLMLKNITKEYNSLRFSKRSSHLAVNQLCLGVQKGECFGLLGVNGAGKTTTFKMLTGDTLPSYGDAFVVSHSVRSAMELARQKIGYCPQMDALLDPLTGRQHLAHMCRLRGLTAAEVNVEVDWALEKLGLKSIADKPAGTYSGGNRRRLSTAIALLGKPPLILLDEPTSGVDPKARRFLWDIIRSVIAEGQSVMVTTHSMAECEALCGRVGVMVNGSFRCMGTPQQLKTQYGEGYKVKVRVCGAVDSAKEFLTQNLKNSVLKEQHSNILIYQLPLEGLNLSDVFNVMEVAREQLDLEDYSITQTTLDDVFVFFANQQQDSGDAVGEDLAATSAVHYSAEAETVHVK